MKLFRLSLNILAVLILLNLFTSFKTVAQNNNILTATQLVSQDSIKNYIQHLENYETRFMIAPNRLEIAIWLQNKFKSFGVDSVRIDTFETHTTHTNLGLDTITKQYNVVAVIPGVINKKLIVCAHYDSYAYGDPFTLAPGADDDASGIAACLESARIFSEINYLPEHTIEIIAFAAEELMNSGLGGYDIYAENAYKNNDTIDLVIHNDMIGYNDGNNTVFFSNYPGCTSETALIASVCNTYTNLKSRFWPSTMGPFADRAFYNRGYKCVYIEENFDANPNYHQITDVLSNMDVTYCAEATKLSIAGTMQYELNNETTSANYSIFDETNFSVFPNPFSYESTIQFNLEANAYIELTLFDITGKKIKILEQGERPSGNYKVDFINNNLRGIYFINLSIDNKRSFTQKVIINSF